MSRMPPRQTDLFGRVRRRVQFRYAGCYRPLDVLCSRARQTVTGFRSDADPA
jgi:hypothetical protein